MKQTLSFVSFSEGQTDKNKSERGRRMLRLCQVYKAQPGVGSETQLWVLWRHLGQVAGLIWWAVSSAVWCTAFHSYLWRSLFNSLPFLLSLFFPVLHLSIYGYWMLTLCLTLNYAMGTHNDLNEWGGAWLRKTLSINSRPLHAHILVHAHLYIHTCSHACSHTYNTCRTHTHK